MFAYAALATLMVIPYTMLAMFGVRSELARLAKNAEEGREAKAALLAEKSVVVRWARFNSVRAMLPLVGGLLGLYSII